MGIFVERQWQKVCVGDFVELPCDEAIPADILLLYTSDPHGICYIETANIDGETNLKQRQIAPESVEQREAVSIARKSHIDQPYREICFAQSIPSFSVVA